MTKTFLSLTLALLAGHSLAQAPPGGPGGPNPPPGWVIQYKGRVYDQDGRLVWSRDQYAASAYDDTREVTQQTDSKGIRGIGSSGSVAFVRGTISVRRKWTGAGTPTPGRNFRIHSNAGALAVFISTATANNGFESKSGPNVAVDSLKLVQPSGDSDGETTVAFSTSGEKASFFVGAAFDDRYARVQISGVPQSYRRGPGSAPATPPRRSFMGVDCGPAAYTPYEPKPVVATASGAGMSMDVDYGLGTGNLQTTRTTGGYGELPSTLTREVKPVHHSITFVANVRHLFDPNEFYDLSTSLVSDKVSETLPSLTITGYNGWDIETLTNAYANPTFFELLSDGVPSSSFEAGHSGKDEKAKLVYRWKDGLQAESTLNVKLHKPVEDGQRWGNPVPNVAVGDWTAVPLKDSRAPTYSASWNYLSSGDPKAYAILSGVVSLLGALPGISDETAFLAAAAAVGLPSSGLEPQYRDFPRGQVTKDNLDWGVSPPLAGGQLPLADVCTWTADTKPEHYVEFFMQDRWGPEDYLGQAPGTKSNPVPPHARQSVRYRFTYVGGTPSGSGTGGNP